MFEPPVYSPRRGSKRYAFTLLEILLAIVLLVIIVTLLATAYMQVDRVVASATAQRERNQTARTVISWITRELQQIEENQNGFRTVAVAGNRSDYATNALGQPFLIRADSAALSGTNGAISGNSVFWPAAMSDTTNSSVAMLGYFVRWVQEGDSTRPVLCRMLIPNSSTNFSQISAATNNAWLTAQLLDQFAPAKSTNQYRGWFADNVLAIWMRALDPNGNPITMAPTITNGTNATTATLLNGNFNSMQGYQYLTTATTTNKVFPTALPASVELALVIGDSRTLQKNTLTHPISASLVTNSSNFWTNIQTYVNQVQTNNPKVGKNLRVYSTRIYLPRNGR